VLAVVADYILSGFPAVLRKARWVGNPVRDSIVQLPPPVLRFTEHSDPLHLLVLGGSLGAQALNQVVPQALRLVPEARRPLVTHQSGAKHLDALQRGYDEAGISAQAVAFIDDIAAQYARADLVICRSGALTVSELAAAGVASILVPFPHAVDDHQTRNARFLVEAGAAVLVQQRELSPRRLADLLLSLTRERLLEMANRARALAKPEATASVADVCIAAAG